MNAAVASGATQQTFEGTQNAENSAPVAAENQPAIDPITLPIARDPIEIADHPPGGTPLSAEAARTLTDQIRRDALLVYVQLLRAYEGDAHGALGYSSWGAYCVAELSIGHRRAYQMIDAARVVNTISVNHGSLEAKSPMGDPDPKSTVVDSTIAPPTERVARELAPLLDDPNELRETYAEATQLASRESNKPPTARQVRAVVEQRRELRPRETATPPAPTKPNPTIGINDAVDALRRAIERDRATAPAAVAVLRDVAAVGVYGPLTRDVPGAFRELVEIVAILLGVSP